MDNLCGFGLFRQVFNRLLSTDGELIPSCNLCSSSGDFIGSSVLDGAAGEAKEITQFTYTEDLQITLKKLR